MGATLSLVDEELKLSMGRRLDSEEPWNSIGLDVKKLPARYHKLRVPSPLGPLHRSIPLVA